MKNDRPERMTWEEYKEKHKGQLGDRLGAGVEREQLEYRKMLDEERNRKVSCVHACMCSRKSFVHSFPLEVTAL